MEIRITASELIDKGVWDDYCEDTGTNVWCVNEGLMPSDEKLTITEEQGKKWGLI